ncbi:MAG: hypothetical protein Q4D07_06340 [Selenomonadaceae bacterium]|nr:hypothetical protein [Selenomonadaceae bacterium]
MQRKMDKGEIYTGIMSDNKCYDYMKKIFVKYDAELVRADRDKIDMYYLYEYTDDIQFITRTSTYPTLFNYVDTGILTEEELAAAILH